jgi:hypothetical protein
MKSDGSIFDKNKPAKEVKKVKPTRAQEIFGKNYGNKKLMYYRCLNCNGAFEAKVFPMMPCETCLKDKWIRAERNRLHKEEIYRSGNGSIDWKLDKERMKFVVVKS